MKSIVSDPKTLGALLKALRKEMALTQEEAAGLCNVGPRFLIELEAGKPTSQIGKVLQVLNGYGLCLTVSRKNLLLNPSHHTKERSPR